MTTSPTIADTPDGDSTSCSSEYYLACTGERIYGLIGNRRYCVLHFPGEKDFAFFQEAVKRKVKKNDFNFNGAWFPPDYYDFPLKLTDASFTGAFFNEGASLSFATFSGRTSFMEATFSGNADLATTFDGDVDFYDVKFGGPVDFQGASFKGPAEFDGAIFADQVKFANPQKFEGRPQGVIFDDNSSLNLEFVTFEKPHLVWFHSVTLRPHWFVNVDARQFQFINVEWKWRSAQQEVASLRGVQFPHRMFAIACRHLAVNAEENQRYEEASKFRYLAMDARRVETWRGFDFRRLSWWYWFASGYGERIWRATVVLLGLMVVCAALYTRVGFARWEPRLANETEAATAKRDEIGAPLKLSRALTYSAAVMTFQRPEPKPATTTAQIVVLLETILGPVQAALLALAIRRKFMR